jgi:hypothetical protein
MDQTDATIKLLAAKGIKIALLGVTPFYKQPVPLVIADRLRQGEDDISAPEALDRDYMQTTDMYMIKRFSNRSDVKYISVLNAMCPKLMCPLVTADETPIYFDQTHLTAAGSRLFARDLTPLILD